MKKLQKTSRSKYNNKTSVYNGYPYDSAKEANYAKDLDLLILAKEIKGYSRQKKISLDVNGQHIANYYMDFEVEENDGSISWHEVKGFETDVWKLKWKLAKALYPDVKFILIK